MTGNVDPTPLSAVQRDRLIRLAERVAWGDIECAVDSFEAALRRAELLTSEEANYWDEELEQELGDEFNVPDDVVRRMPPERKLALTARLVRSAAFGYGRRGADPEPARATRDSPSNPRGVLHAALDALRPPGNLFHGQ
jgi:hypothetical protein